MMFVCTRCFGVVLISMTCSASVFADSLTLSTEAFTPRAATIVYDPSDGSLSANGGGELLTVIDIRSASICLGPQPREFDVGICHLFKLRPDGFDSVDFGSSYLPGFTAEEVIRDLSVDGSWVGGGPLSNYVSTSPHLYVVPEPSVAMIAGCGTAIFLLRRRSSSAARDDMNASRTCRRVFRVRKGK